jgi:hypothetical protein
MFTALLGAITAQLTMARLHDRNLKRLEQLNGTSCKCPAPHDISY